MEMIPSPRLGFLRGVFLASHLASTDNLARTTKRQNTQQRKLTIHKRGPNNNNNNNNNNTSICKAHNVSIRAESEAPKPQHKKNMLRYYRQNKPGLVALYDIRPGNGVGLFLQPRSPHRAGDHADPTGTQVDVVASMGDGNRC